MTTNGILTCKDLSSWPVRQVKEKNSLRRPEVDQASPWWAVHRSADETFERNLVVASATLLTSTFKRLG